MSASIVVITAPLLADAYPPRQRKLDRKFLTHAFEIDSNREPIRVLCRKVQLDSVCDGATWTNDEPTCATCAVRVRRLKANGFIS
jgi:hypothetical protein